MKRTAFKAFLTTITKATWRAVRLTYFPQLKVIGQCSEALPQIPCSNSAPYFTVIN